MERRYISLFDKTPHNYREPTSAPQGKKGVQIPMPFSLLLIPVVFIGAAISIPWMWIRGQIVQRREKRFANRMLAAGRSITWKELDLAMAKNQGTIIGEHLSFKGPFRLWWTPEDIPATTPHKYDHYDLAWLEPEFAPFFEWCNACFTNPQSGTARLVMISPGEFKSLKEKLTGTRFVSIRSFH